MSLNYWNLSLYLLAQILGTAFSCKSLIFPLQAFSTVGAFCAVLMNDLIAKLQSPVERLGGNQSKPNPQNKV